MENYVYEIDDLDIDVIPAGSVSDLLTAPVAEDAEGVIIPAESESENELLVLASEQNNILSAIRDDVHYIMFFLLLTFCWSCVRAWRKNFTKGV